MFPSSIDENKNVGETDQECQNSFQESSQTEIKADGFCFKLAPVENQADFNKNLAAMAPGLADFKKGTTTLAFEF